MVLLNLVDRGKPQGMIVLTFDQMFAFSGCGQAGLLGLDEMRFPHQVADGDTNSYHVCHLVSENGQALTSTQETGGQI